MPPATRSSDSSLVKPAATPVSGIRSARTAEFYKEGEFWSVGLSGAAFRLKGTKGLGYLAHLLRHPGTEFHVLDLVSGIATAHEDDESGQSSEHGLPRGAEELEKAARDP
jgi:hypothetical protein